MPRYQVTLDGRTFVVEGDRPPTEAEARQALSSHMESQKAPEQPKAEQPEQKSIGGFMSNIFPSLGRLVRDSAVGLKDAAVFAATGSGLAGDDLRALQRNRVGQLVMQPRAVAGTVGQAAKERYGSLDAIGNTLYNDPAGVAADVSTLLTMGGTAAARAPRVASVLAKAGEVTNPLRAVTAPVRAGTRTAANLTVRGTLRPPKAVREDFGGSKGVANAVLDERVYSDASAQRKLSKSVQDADDLLKAKEAAGTRGVPAKDVANAVVGQPLDVAMRRERLGVPNATGAVADRRQRILDANRVPGQPNATRLIPLTEAQGLKREAQDLAYEARKAGLSLDAQADQSVARALREGIEARVPEVGPINQRSQRLLGAQRAFSEAEDRPRALANFLAILGGAGGFAGGGTAGAAATSALMKAADSPRLGALAGITLNEAGNFINAPLLRQAALLARLSAEEPE